MIDHCNDQIFNLDVVDSVKAISDATQFFALVGSLYVILPTTKVHVVFLLKQNMKYINYKINKNLYVKAYK